LIDFHKKKLHSGTDYRNIASMKMANSRESKRIETQELIPLKKIERLELSEIKSQSLGIEAFFR
jgi:hypothetical protein